MSFADLVAKGAVAHGAMQKTHELAGLLTIAATVKPRVIVEIGSDHGGTLYAWRTAFPTARVISIDLPDGPYGSARPLQSHGAEVIAADSHDPATKDKLIDALMGQRIDVLFIDGDHTYEGVTADAWMYGELVRPGGLVAFHDICHHPNVPSVGVDRAWAELSRDLEDTAEYIGEPATWGGIGVGRKPMDYV